MEFHRLEDSFKKANYSKKFILTDLEPGITYEILVEGRSNYQDKFPQK